MKPTEYHDPLQNGNQTSGEQQSNSQGAGSTQATQSDASNPSHANETPQPLAVPPGLNVRPLPEYSPAINEEAPPYPGPPLVHQHYYRPGTVRFFRRNGEDDAMALIPLLGPDSPFPHERRRTNLRLRHPDRIRIFCMLINFAFVFTAIILLLDSIFTEFTALQLSEDVRNGIYNETRWNNNTTGTYDPCHLYDTNSISLNAASNASALLPLLMILLKIICFPILMFITTMALFCPNMLHIVRNHMSRTVRLAAQAFTLEMLEPNENGNVQQEGRPNNGPSREPENAPSRESENGPSGELEDASESQSNSREYN